MRFSPALLNHAETLLAELLSSSLPADAVVSYYFRQNPKLGHADRGFIANLAWTGAQAVAADTDGIFDGIVAADGDFRRGDMVEVGRAWLGLPGVAELAELVIEQ